MRLTIRRPLAVRLVVGLGLAGVVVAVTLPAPGPADAAAAADRMTRTFSEPASRGLAVSGPLAGFRVTSKARIVVPTRWERRDAPTGSLAFRHSRGSGCTYNLTYSVRSVIGPVQDAQERVTAALPAAGARYVLDSGRHGTRAFRVVRQKSVGGRVRIDAQWSGVLTKRDDIAPAGKAAWTDIRVVARSRQGDECHSGTWRKTMGPDIGDSLAVARTGLRFTRPS
ncbi:MAG: hypothetical protein JWP18_1542 [Solirubrobacterales bacterium]|jgi:hypothetical protein|nr:hypothetical protein [Solirubrobacterales bacterium]